MHYTVEATTTRIGVNTIGILVIRRFGKRPVVIGMWTLAVFVGSLGGDLAKAEPIQWADLATCYDRGVFERKPIVMLLYDKVTGRVDADMASTRLSLSPRIQAVASKAVWCIGDVSSNLVSRNIGKALQIKSYPSVSVLAPNGEALDEAARIAGMGARIDSFASEKTAEEYIVNEVEELSAKYSGPH